MNETYLPVIGAAAIITYLTRFTGLSPGKRHPPAFVRHFLSFVPVSAFAALLVPDLVRGGNDAAPRLLGAGIAAMVVLYFGKLWACIAVGMTVYWLSGWLL